ncbi:MAG: hypothetical protein IJS37_01630 [Bacilli bacterium]|nr:hypothetical protein [Bacilli bacterium]
MKRALSLYDDLKSAFDYLTSSWLRYSVNERTEQEAMVILFAGSFLFDNLFAKEDAGKDITALAAKELGDDFKPNELAETATKLRLAMNAEHFASNGSPLRDYLLWVAEEHPVVMEMTKDLYGLLPLAVAEAISSLLMEQNEHFLPTEVAELSFLNFVTAFHLNYKELEGPRFNTRDSASAFLDVEDEMERITKENVN